jgi:membrane peptidoglycan carboxypeptidase
MKFVYKVLTFPFLAVAKVFYVCNFNDIKNDLDKCIDTIDSKKRDIPDLWIDYLIFAEDHRFNIHYGIDFYSILRAIHSTKYKRIYQGASTIQQQYVRVVTSRYERTLWRKIREQLLAIILTNKKDKLDIAKSYLTIAFYGSKQDGLDAYLKRKNKKIDNVSNNEALALVSMLKYPEPLTNKDKWHGLIDNRMKYIIRRMN